MSRHISQETFDAAVAENIELLDMTPEEAVEEAVKQFEAQGVNLETIVKEHRLPGSEEGAGTTEHAAILAVKELETVLHQTPVNKADLITACDALQVVCSKGLAERCLAAKNGGFTALQSALSVVKEDCPSLLAILTALESLIDGNPDVASDDARQCYVELLRQFSSTSLEVTLAILKVVHKSCVMHEQNRQSYVGLGLIPTVAALLLKHTSNADLVQAVCSVYSVLTLDDDVRVPHGHAHEHAKLIVFEGDALTALLMVAKEHMESATVLSKIFGVIARLCVRDEFCQQVADLGGIETTFNVMQKHISDQPLVRCLLSLVKVLAGSDRIKAEVVRSDGISVLVDVIRSHHRNAGICEAGCAAVGAIVLRFPAHSDAVIEAGGPEVICTAMQLHSSSAAVQTQGCVCIRNVVSRRSDLADAFLSLGAEQLLRSAQDKHRNCRDEAKAALRDLGCHIELKELWTGSGRQLARD